MRVYIAGKFTDSDPVRQAEHIALAVEVGKAVRELGHEAFVPHVQVGDPPPGLTPEEIWIWAMRRCVKALASCDGVVLVPNWRESRGARLERNLASDLGMPVFEGLVEFFAATS